MDHSKSFTEQAVPKMKPYVICHMVSSVDGRTLISRWRPTDPSRKGLFERLHDRLGADA